MNDLSLGSIMFLVYGIFGCILLLCCAALIDYFIPNNYLEMDDDE